MDNFLVLKVDGSGRTLCTQSWGGPDNDDLRAMISASDQTVILIGHRDAVSWPLEQTPGLANWYLVKAQRMVDSCP